MGTDRDLGAVPPVSMGDYFYTVVTKPDGNQVHENEHCLEDTSFSIVILSPSLFCRPALSSSLPCS